MSPIDLVRSRLEAAGCHPRGSSARCPAHDDHNPSLSIGEGREGQALVRCHHEPPCTLDAILAALSLTVTDLFPDSTSTAPAVSVVRRTIAAYPYTDEHGELLYEVVRREPKEFRQRRPDGNGGWLWNLRDTRRVLYRLPEVCAAVSAGRRVLVVEGEKDADRLAQLGFAATCNAMGSGGGKWRPEYTQALAGAHVAIIPDNDEPGRMHAQAVAHALHGTAASVRLVDLPGAPPDGGDVSDWLDAGGTVEQLKTLIEAAPDLDTAPVLDASIGEFFIDWQGFWQRDRREAEWAYADVLAKGRGHALYASHKAGKSLLMLHVAVTLATAREPFAVVYLDYEMGEDDLYERLLDMGYGPDVDLSRLHYALLPSLPPLDTRAGAEALCDILDRVQAERPDHHLVVVLDTTARAVAGEENAADTFRAFYAHTGIELKRRGITWARLDHAGKDPTRGQRGSSSKGDDVDVVWKLVATERGVELRRDVARMAWVPEKVTFHLSENPLTYTRVAGDWPAGTRETAAVLDRLDVALDASAREAARRLKDAGEGVRDAVVRAAVKWRRQEHATVLESTAEPVDNRRDAPRDAPNPVRPGRTPGRTPENPHNHAPDAPPDAPGRTPPGTASRSRPPLGGRTGTTSSQPTASRPPHDDLKQIDTPRTCHACGGRTRFESLTDGTAWCWTDCTTEVAS